METQTVVRTDLERYTWVVYALQIASLFFLISSLIGFVVNVIKKDDVAEDPVLAAHFRWQMRTFIWQWVWALVVVGLFATVIGALLAIPLGGIVFGWSMYRTVRGMLALMDHRSPKVGY